MIFVGITVFPRGILPVRFPANQYTWETRVLYVLQFFLKRVFHVYSHVYRLDLVLISNTYITCVFWSGSYLCMKRFLHSFYTVCKLNLDV